MTVDYADLTEDGGPMTLDLDRLHLERGAHPAGDGVCVMEAAALFAGERQSDCPACVSPVIGAFLRRWNDALDDDDRQQLKPLIPVIVGSASTADDDYTRRWVCADWLVRVYVPVWLRAADLADLAAALEALPTLDAGTDMAAVMPVLTAAGTAAGTAAVDQAATWTAGLDAAWALDAARAAAWDAARTAVWASAWDAAGDAALDTARTPVPLPLPLPLPYAAVDAVGTVARTAARAAAWDAAWDEAATWASAGASAGASVSRAAARALRPTVETLQTSALDLVRRMAGRQ